MVRPDLPATLVQEMAGLKHSRNLTVACGTL